MLRFPLTVAARGCFVNAPIAGARALPQPRNASSSSQRRHPAPLAAGGRRSSPLAGAAGALRSAASLAWLRPPRRIHLDQLIASLGRLCLLPAPRVHGGACGARLRHLLCSHRLEALPKSNEKVPAGEQVRS